MGDLIKNIHSINDFFYIQNTYKSITRISSIELKFCFLNLESGLNLPDILEFTKDYSNWAEIDYQLLEENDKNSLYYIIIKKIVSEEEKTSELVMCFDKNKGDVIAMSDEDREKFVFIENFLDKLTVHLNRKFIKSEEIINIINDFLVEGYQVTASMVSVKKWWENVRRSGLEWPTGIPISGVLKEIKEKKSFIDSIDIDVSDQTGKNVLLRTYLSRRGIIKFREGFFDLFKDKILNKINSFIKEEKRFLKNRSREKENLKPLKISFEKLAEFSPIEVTKQFAKSISQNKELSLAIIHDGNPYFYASVTNNNDGSVFDIIFQNLSLGSELVVIPQYSVSLNSLAKFLSGVYSQFGEGKISEYSEG